MRGHRGAAAPIKKCADQQSTRQALGAGDDALIDNRQ
jgi:hypothetical protein